MGRQSASIGDASGHAPQRRLLRQLVVVQQWPQSRIGLSMLCGLIEERHRGQRRQHALILVVDAIERRGQKIAREWLIAQLPALPNQRHRGRSAMVLAEVGRGLSHHVGPEVGLFRLTLECFAEAVVHRRQHARLDRLLEHLAEQSASLRRAVRPRAKREARS